VKLSDIINIISFQSYNSAYYIDKEKGEPFLVSKEQLRAAEEDVELEDYPEWEREQIKLARAILTDKEGERYILIPGQFVRHEYSKMENFCFSLDDDEVSRALLQAIIGAGAFSRFNNCIHRYGVADDWYRYRYNSMKRIVIDWCEANNIEYVEK
jgi:DNA polymerase III alpha subunit